MTDGANVTEPRPNQPHRATRSPRHYMDALFFLGLLVLWIVLQVWVLPKVGVRT
jgi:hypothetical protein